MPGTPRETLYAARDALIEVEAIRRAIDATNANLYSAPSAPRFGRVKNDSFIDDYRREEAMDQKKQLTALLAKKLAAKEELVAQADKYIESIPDARKRAALRFYFLGAARSYEAVAELVGCSDSSVKRWIKSL